MKLIDGQKITSIKLWIKDILIAIIIVNLIIIFLYQNFKVIGGSMLPTLGSGEVVVVNKFVYSLTEPEIGDIIGFKSGDNKIVKRIIAEPDDVVNYSDGMIYVNGEPINTHEEYIKIGGDIVYPYIVPSNSYFVIGDNYNNSIDSRYKSIGAVHEDEIIGKVQFRLWPFWKKPLLINKS